MADLGLLGFLPAGLAAWALAFRPVVYLVCLTAGSIRLRNEGRDWSEAEAHQLGQQQIINTGVDLVTKGFMAIEWAAIGAGVVHICQNLPLHASIWWRGRKRDARLAYAWFKALFTDKAADKARKGRAQFEEASLRRAALFTSEAYDFEPIVWDGLPVDPDHARARDEYEHLARKPQLSSAEGSQLALVLLSLQNYGDNPLAIRRGGVATATVAPQGFLAAGTALAAVTGGWAWIAPRALVALAVALVVVGLQWRSERSLRLAAQTAEQTVRATMVATAKALDESRATIIQTREQCIAEITKAAEATKTKLAAESAARKRRQARAQEQAAAGGAAPILDPREWMRGITGTGGGDGSAAPAAEDSGPVPDAGPGPAPAGDQGHLSNQP